MVNMALGGTGHTHTQTRFSNFGPKCDAFKAEIDEILEIKAFECMEDVQKGQKFGECRSCRPPTPVLRPRRVHTTTRLSISNKLHTTHVTWAPSRNGIKKRAMNAPGGDCAMACTLPPHT
jgi:hypothetical protein